MASYYWLLDIPPHTCISEELEKMLRGAGFADIRIQPVDTSRAFIHEWLPGKNPGDYVLSASIEALKP